LFHILALPCYIITLVECAIVCILFTIYDAGQVPSLMLRKKPSGSTLFDVAAVCQGKTTILRGRRLADGNELIHAFMWLKSRSNTKQEL